MANRLSDPRDSVTIHISTLSIVKILAVLLGIGFVYLVWDTITLIFVSLLFAAALSPAVNWMESKKLPRSLAMLVIYVAILSVVSILLVLIIPPIAKELADLASTFPTYYQRLLQSFNISGNGQLGASLHQAIGNLGQSLSKASGSVFGALINIFGGLITFVTLLVLTFYFAVKKDSLKSLTTTVTPVKYQKYVMNVLSRIQEKLGLWLRGQLLLSGIIFVMTLIGLLILRVPYALVLALLAGVLEAVPFIGPVIAGVPAVLLALTVSPFMGLLVAGLYLVVQQLENNIIVPKVMQKTVGLNPILVIIAILLGAKLSGILGALLAIPVATALMVVVCDWWGMEEQG